MAGPFIRAISRLVVGKKGKIMQGIGAGLDFDATDGFPGYLLGTSEPQEQYILDQLLEPGETFYDVGANIGFYSTLAGRLVGSTGRVYAFEPFPKSAGFARLNAEMNNFSHVQVIEAAVTQQNTTVTLSVAESSAHHSTAHSEYGEKSIQVKGMSIDSFLQGDVRKPDVIMIDVEGAEMEVLYGMTETIEVHKPTIMCEVHWIGDDFTKFCDQILFPLDYTVSTYFGEPIPKNLERYHALLLSPKHQSRIDHA
jgi:FkbM family methyltransferase